MTDTKTNDTTDCRYHFPVEFKVVKGCLDKYRESMKIPQTLLSPAAYDELKDYMNDPTSLWFHLDYGNKRIFAGDRDTFHQFVSTLTTYFCDNRGGKDWITYIWSLSDEDVKKYVIQINELHAKSCPGEKCAGRQDFIHLY